MPASKPIDPPQLYTTGQYLENNPGWHVEDSAWKAKQILTALRKANISPRSVCDIGCGAGEVISCLADEMPDCEFHGYELSPQAYAMAKTHESNRCRYFHLDGLKNPQREHYDIAMAHRRCRACRRLFHLSSPPEATCNLQSIICAA